MGVRCLVYALVRALHQRMQVDDDGALALARVIAANHPIRKIDVNFNQITNLGVRTHTLLVLGHPSCLVCFVLFLFYEMGGVCLSQRGGTPN